MQQKIQTGLRIPVERYDEFCKMSEHMGISLNAVVLFLADVGLTALNRGIEQETRSLPRSPQYTAE